SATQGDVERMALPPVIVDARGTALPVQAPPPIAASAAQGDEEESGLRGTSRYRSACETRRSTVPGPRHSAASAVRCLAALGAASPCSRLIAPRCAPPRARLHPLRHDPGLNPGPTPTVAK